MTLKSFEKVNVAVRTEYDVFNKRGEYVETFRKDYLDKNCRISDKCVIDYDKLMQYANATVTGVRTKRIDNSLSVSLTIK